MKTTRKTIMFSGTLAIVKVKRPNEDAVYSVTRRRKVLHTFVTRPEAIEFMNAETTR